MNKMLNKEQQRLVEDNHNLIYSFMRDHNIIDKEYYYFIFAEALCRAAGAYDPEKGKFSTFAYKYMNNDYKRDIRIQNMKKRKWNGEMVYLDAKAFDYGSESKESFTQSEISFEDKVVDQADVQALAKAAKEALTAAEWRVFCARIAGKNYNTIKKETGADVECARSMYHHAKKKLKSLKIL